MREMWQHRGMRLIFTANLISMIGSGMNSAAVIWYILQATHSEVSLGALIALQTLPSMLLLPFTGVIIDREDRRRLMMWLDAARAVIIATVAVLVFTHHVRLWHVYLMNILVAIGFWMFFPTVNALIQELTPDDRMLDSNSLLLAALQGGWLMAGAVVGFVYNHVGLGGVLMIDCASYAVSIACVFHVRRGRVTVSRPEPAVAGIASRYLHELVEGYGYIHENRRVLLIGAAWALFVAAMMTQGVLSAPLSERILHGGAVGYGWLNAGWAVGAFVSVFYAAGFIRRHGANRSVTLTMGIIAASLFLLPVSRWLALAVPIYFMMGSSRGVGGIALSSEMMQLVPRHFMGRVQNAFSFLASALQICTALLVGEAAHRQGLIYGFWMVGAMYLGAALAAWLPVRRAMAGGFEPSDSAAD
ncbi:MAG TPA: MFS transporter [Candidatus Binatia bacterium]|nr:MFS transporter [Candidatus Binatia bacterium]